MFAGEETPLHKNWEFLSTVWEQTYKSAVPKTHTPPKDVSYLFNEISSLTFYYETPSLSEVSASDHHWFIMSSGVPRTFTSSKDGRGILYFCNIDLHSICDILE